MCYNWDDVKEAAAKYFCFERQRTGGCPCRNDIPGRRKTKCVFAQNIIKECEKELPDPYTIARFLYTHTCGQWKSSRYCRHHTCSIHQRLIDWLEQFAFQET